jgi:hypothetical protein
MVVELAKNMAYSYYLGIAERNKRLDRKHKKTWAICS